MDLLKDRIRTEGRILPGNILKVGTFLNHQMDIGLFNEIGKEFLRAFRDAGIDRILTIEASGIGIACITAQYFKVPAVFAKKSKTKNLSGDFFTAQVTSYTHNTEYTIHVSRDAIRPGEQVLLIDDFLANGCALEGLAGIVSDAGARVAGAGIVIEKGFQGGGDRLRASGIRVESLAIIESMSPENGVVFR